MPAFRFLVPGLGSVTMSEDNETCARARLAEHLGVDMDRLHLAAREQGAPVWDPDRAQREREGSYDDHPDICDCSDCAPSLLRATRLEAALMGLAAAASFLAIWALRRR